MKKERIKGRKNYPTEEIDPVNFLDDETVKNMVKNINKLKLTPEDFKKIYNCVDCNECETEKERILLKQKYLEQGNSFEGWKEMLEYFEKYRTPYPSNEMRIKIPKEVPKKSNTLFFMGCLSTIRIPHYTENAIKYLLDQGVDFTILDREICCGWPWYVSGSLRELEICKKENLEIFKNYDRIICLCPACYFLFLNDYSKDLGKKVEIQYITDYLKPSKQKKSGTVAFQHLCQLMNRGKEGIDQFVEEIFKKSGYKIANVPHWCCGGGIGYMHRTDVIEEIAKKRMNDFNRNDIDYITTYCVSCWWILSRFCKKCKIKPKAKDIFELLL